MYFTFGSPPFQGNGGRASTPSVIYRGYRPVHPASRCGRSSPIYSLQIHIYTYATDRAFPADKLLHPTDAVREFNIYYAYIFKSGKHSSHVIDKNN